MVIWIKAALGRDDLSEMIYARLWRHAGESQDIAHDIQTPPPFCTRAYTLYSDPPVTVGAWQLPRTVSLEVIQNY